LELFAVSQPGIEEVTAEELKELGIKGRVVPGGVEFSGGLEELYRCNLWLRTATRVLVRFCQFKAKHFAELVRKAKRCKWENFLKPEISIRIRVTSRRSKLYHTKAIEERILRSIEEAVGFSPKLSRFEDEGTSIVVRFERDICTISINSSGPPLYKRGYRVAETEAPLRENLAAAMILLSGWKGEVPLIDPFCGSGTIPIEAALLAANIPPGRKRTFAFMEWKNFDEELFRRILSEIKERSVKSPILGFDIEEKAVKASAENAKAAGVLNLVKFENLSFPSLSFKEGVVITNPPYGKRLSVRNVKEIYRRLGEWVESQFSSYKLLFLSPSESLAKETGLNVRKITHFSNGGITVGLYRADR